MSVPTRTAPMREAILVAFFHPEIREGGPVFSETLQFFIEHRFADGDFTDWDMRAPHGKAFHRALEGLRADGLLTRDDIDGFVVVAEAPTVEEPTR